MEINKIIKKTGHRAMHCKTGAFEAINIIYNNIRQNGIVYIKL